LWRNVFTNRAKCPKMFVKIFEVSLPNLSRGEFPPGKHFRWRKSLYGFRAKSPNARKAARGTIDLDGVAH
jgi:hypothetical protein